MKKQDLLLVKGMQFWGKHGLNEEENLFGQRFLVDIEVQVDMNQMCETDDPSTGLSYITVYALAKRVVEGEQHRLIQRLAQRIADEVIAAYPIEAIKVAVKKPSVAIGGIVDYVGCSIVRKAKEI